jgi:hypothetical protein
MSCLVTPEGCAAAMARRWQSVGNLLWDSRFQRLWSTDGGDVGSRYGRSCP